MKTKNEKSSAGDRCDWNKIKPADHVDASVVNAVRDCSLNDVEKVAVDEGDICSATRLFRERTGLGLMEARQAIADFKRSRLECFYCGGAAKIRIGVTTLDGEVLELRYSCYPCAKRADFEVGEEK